VLAAEGVRDRRRLGLAERVATDGFPERERVTPSRPGREYRHGHALPWPRRRREHAPAVLARVGLSVDATGPGYVVYVEGGELHCSRPPATHGANDLPFAPTGAQLSFTDHDRHRFLATLTNLAGDAVELERLHRSGAEDRVPCRDRHRAIGRLRGNGPDDGRPDTAATNHPATATTARASHTQAPTARSGHGFEWPTLRRTRRPGRYDEAVKGTAASPLRASMSTLKLETTALDELRASCPAGGSLSLCAMFDSRRAFRPIIPTSGRKRGDESPRVARADRWVRLRAAPA